MTAWLRRKDVPVQPLAEDRKRLVHSYMDADEEAARRQEIEERELQPQARALVRGVPSEDRPRPDADSAGKTQRKAAGESELGADDFADLVRREAAKQAARQVAAARRAADEQVEQRIAAAVEEARREVSREAAEETARQVAAAEERARRLAVEAAAQQVAAAEERARAAAAEETVRLVASAEERARAEVAEEVAQQIAAAAAEQAARQTAAAEELSRAQAVEETARQSAATARLEHPETLEQAPTRAETNAGAVHDASGVSVSGEEFQDPAEKALEEMSPAARDLAREDSVEGLPVFEWIHAATRSDGAGDAPDWTRDLLRIRDKTQTDWID